MSAKGFDFPCEPTVIAVNGGWHACPDRFDWWLHSNDYEGARPPVFADGQREVLSYQRELDRFGGNRRCGWSITLNAAYWALHHGAQEIGFIGCDMNYRPDANGNTHVYGVGIDIQKRGMSDPDWMARQYGDGYDDYLTFIYKRFEGIAKDRGCAVFNLSSDPETRLPFLKKS